MPKRLYFSTLGDAPAITPSPDSDWDVVNQAGSPLTLRQTPTAEAWPLSVSINTTAVSEYLALQAVSLGLRSGQVVSSMTVTTHLLGSITSSACILILGARIIAGDGVTVRRTLFLPSNVHTISTTLSNTGGDVGATITSYTTVDGDRLVFEFGVLPNTSASRTGVLYFGSETGIDLPEDYTTTSHGRPWIELSQDLEFYDLDANVGSFAIAGQNATLLASRSASPDVGEFAVAGQDAEGSFGRSGQADAGEFAVAGQDVEYLLGKVIEAEVGGFAVDGQDAALIGEITLDAEAAEFTLAGQDADLVYGRFIDQEPGAFVIDGQDVVGLVAKGVEAEVGVFTVLGKDAGLRYSGDTTAPRLNRTDSLVWLLIDETGGTW